MMPLSSSPNISTLHTLDIATGQDRQYNFTASNEGSFYMIPDLDAYFFFGTDSALSINTYGTTTHYSFWETPYFEANSVAYPMEYAGYDSKSKTIYAYNAISYASRRRASASLRGLYARPTLKGSAGSR